MLGGLGGSAAAETILDERADWTPSGARIMTTRTVLTDDGRVETRVTPGGSIDGVRMVRFHLIGPGVMPYVPARSTAGADVRWKSGCVYVTPDVDGTSDVAGDGEAVALGAALSEWEGRTQGCGYQGFVREAPEPREVGYDGVNTIKYRHDRWCRPAVDGDEEECYMHSAAAITTLIHVDRAGSPDDGRLLDADIEMNAVDFAFTVDGTTLGEGTLADVQNTLTHELGHLLGLDHTCWDREGDPPLDADGERVPLCRPSAALGPEVTGATMYNYQLAGETSKRTIEDDDVRGACGLYPLAEDPGTCEPAPAPSGAGCGCVVAARTPRGTGGWPALALAALLGGMTWTRVRRR